VSELTTARNPAPAPCDALGSIVAVTIIVAESPLGRSGPVK
jgi:hypothetical protein